MRRRLTLRSGGEEIAVTVYRVGEKIVVERDGERHEILVTSDQPAYDAPAAAPGTAPGAGGAAADAPAMSARGGTGEAAGEVLAPMVGFVREIHAKQGETVAAGDRVVTMEAMKMDIYVVAPVSGVVGPVLVSPGDTVGEGAVLLTIAEPEGP